MRKQDRHDAGMMELARRWAQDDEFKQAYKFFRENAGGWVGHNAESALRLTKAEQDAKARGVVFVWAADDDADWSWMTEEDLQRSHEVEWCRAVVPCPEHGVECRHAETLASLGGIFDASHEYRRVVEAELALEGR